MKIIYGDDYDKIRRITLRELGDEYEVIEGESLLCDNLPSVFLGNSLFSDSRKILIKDLSLNKECFSQLIKYVSSPHNIIIVEGKLDKRLTVVKELSKAGVEIIECNKASNFSNTKVFDVFNYAFSGDYKRAYNAISKIESEQDPFMFFGLLVTQALKKFEYRQGAKEKRVLFELSLLDKQMKSSDFYPWDLIRTFILKISQL